MIELNNCWRIWSKIIDGDSVIYGQNEQHSFYLTSRVTNYQEYEWGALATTLTGEVKLVGKVTKLKASDVVFRNIQTGLAPNDAIDAGQTTTPLAASLKAEAGKDNHDDR